MPGPLIGITGATGHIGRLVATRLAGTGARLRLLARDPSRLPTLNAPVQVARTSYEDTAEARAALAGVEVLFMVSAAESADRLAQHTGFLDAAAAAGVRHVVYTSFLGAAPQATFTLARDHWVTEEHLRSLGLAWTVLRDSFYLDFLPDLAGPDGAIRGPAGTGRVGAVARADVARVAAAVLSAPESHAGAVHDLTGPQALTLAEVAETITRVTGRSTTYVDETIEQAYASRAVYHAADWQVDAWVSTYTAIAKGELARLTGTVQRIGGQPPLSLAELLRSRS